ncbi:hypothetical protein [uncultured Microbacterium sp.]|uniref:DUF7426 family protein n=1 Tax=uncultured Microbacterium sp. TaxID=191216 RepID=UPI0025F2546C|nr:hypothetical protein [uncultured Microbacterium sp.]
MASASDFKAWAQPDLVIPFRGRDFIVAPPSVDDSAKLLACAVRAEVAFGLAEGPIPDEVHAVLDTISPDEHPALGSVYNEMVAAGLSPVTIDRMAVYAIFYWARGEEYADKLATVLWTPRELPEAGEPAGPKAS